MADLGIRLNVDRKFIDLLPQRLTLGNTRFRAEVIGYAMESFGVTLASAATHYNHAKIEAAKVPEHAALMEGLGRAEDKKGGRKPKVKAVVEATVVEEQQVLFTVKRKKDGEMVAEGLCFADATALINKAAAAKKSKLYWV